MRGLFMLTAFVAAGCYVRTVEYVERPQPPAQAPHGVRVAGRLEMNGAMSGTLEEGVAIGHAAAITAGASIAVSASSPVPVELLVYGPFAGDWDRMPILARGARELALSVPYTGTYVIAAIGQGGAPFSVSLSCTSGECRAECAGDGTGCPEGSGCALVMCIRAPCPSYCHPLVETAPPDMPPQNEGGEGAVCGTRGAAQCAPGLTCIHPDSASCGETDMPGTCQTPPQVCTREYRPVCGCDGRTYGTRCVAYAAGVSVRHEGECGQGNPPQADCQRTGCSGELCMEPGQDVSSICIHRPEFACYQAASCERQSDGRCGWTETPELRACLANPPR